MVDKKEIYQFNDKLLFEVILPAIPDLVNNLDMRTVEFICPKHSIRLTDTGPGKNKTVGYRLVCPMCKREMGYTYTEGSSTHSLESLKKQALALHDKDLYKNAKLVRLDDYYVPEIRKFDALPGDKDYSIKADVKTDKDGDTIVVLYLGYKGEKEKSQIFIKPEKVQLSSDHKDMDPAKILAKIELTLRGRSISQAYEVE